MTDVEIISKLCEIDEEIRTIKKRNTIAVDYAKQLGISILPPHLMKMVPEVLDSARTLLAAKRELRKRLWEEYHIFYWSDV